MASAKAETVPLISAKISSVKELKKTLNDESKVSAELDRADQVLGKCAQLLGECLLVDPFLEREMFQNRDNSV